MCNCPSCEVTDSFRTKPFSEWPRGNPAGKRSSEATYRAHADYVWKDVRKSLTLGNPFPCRGTPQTDPRIYYHFPGGQVGQARTMNAGKLVPRTERPAATDDAHEYALVFCEANHLIVEAP